MYLNFGPKSVGTIYSAEIVLDNDEFRATVVCLGILAVFNLALSVRPTGMLDEMDARLH